MGKVIGIGGVFLACASIETTRLWYKRVLGLDVNDQGGCEFKAKGVAEAFPKSGRSIWATFDKNDDPFAPSLSEVMISLVVDDLDAVVARAEKRGAKQVQPRQFYESGKFAWFLDPDGRKVELWEPVEPLL